MPFMIRLLGPFGTETDRGPVRSPTGNQRRLRGLLHAAQPDGQLPPARVASVSVLSDGDGSRFAVPPATVDLLEFEQAAHLVARPRRDLRGATGSDRGYTRRVVGRDPALLHPQGCGPHQARVPSPAAPTTAGEDLRTSA